MPLALVLLCLVIYNANLRQIGAGDTIAARYLPLVLWHDGTLELETHSHLIARGHPMAYSRFRPANTGRRAVYFEPSAYWLVRTRDHELASFYPPVASLLVAPLYAPAVLWLDTQGWEQPQVDRVAEWMEKFAASILAAAASVLVFLLLRREGNPWSLPLALAFAFGTNTWMISSQALWQHGAGEFLIALALFLVLGRTSALRLTVLGAVCVLMAANRPPDALVAAALGLFIVGRQWRSAAWLMAGAVIPLAALLYYNVGFIGHLAGGYGVVKPPQDFFQSAWTGVAGLLVSPTRGLLIFTPFLIFVPLGLIQRLRSPETRGLAIALGVAVIAQIALYAHADWRAGISWGPRWLTDLLPILIWMLAPAVLVLRSLTRSLLVAAIVASIGVQTVGAFWYTKTSDELIYGSDAAPLQGAWNWGNIPFVTELQHPPARGELLCDARGSIDRIGATLHPGAAKEPALLEPDAILEGWSLACARSPAQVMLLIDGFVVGSTTEFLPRPDVDDALQTRAPSGWRLSANLWGIASGERTLQLAVRIEPRSDIRIVREQRVIVTPQIPASAPVEPSPSASAASLAAMAARAASQLREHQTSDGAWLTAHTPVRRFEAAQQELNTFTTSTLVDLLSPLARRHDLDVALERARAHLGAQIESNGLVRYHGLPDGPAIGTLGCAITPDADDSALVWRIAGHADDPRRKAMLDTLARYRDARGFYRTWLAPKNRFQCIDPGSDPNPTDIAIQMNVYLMLREADPAAARQLCDALQRSSDDEDIWVYYAKSPLLPYVRTAELRELGCPLALPVGRLALPAEDQAIWSEAVHRLVDITTTPPTAAARQAAHRTLAQLGNDGFALLRRTPPLLYHNDLSATVRRFYWSEDVGYALWLRLYEASRIDTVPQPEATP